MVLILSSTNAITSNKRRSNIFGSWCASFGKVLLPAALSRLSQVRRKGQNALRDQGKGNILIPRSSTILSSSNVHSTYYYSSMRTGSRVLLVRGYARSSGLTAAIPI